MTERDATQSWPGEAEAALIDPIFSSGGTSSRIGRLVNLWRVDRWTGRHTPLDDLHELSGCDPEKVVDLFESDEMLPTLEVTKAETVIAAARALSDAGFWNSASLVSDDPDGEAATAFQSVAGLGRREWHRLLAALAPRARS